MAQIIVFGAGGRAGRAILAEARTRGHEVTAVVRDPARHRGLDAVAGDVTDAARIARVAAGHDVAVHAAGDLATPPREFFPSAVRALLTGLSAAGVPRLVAVGLGSNLPNADGVLLRDTPGYPNEYREFILGHAAGTDLLRDAAAEIAWTILAPAGDFDHTGAPVGGYRLAPGDPEARLTYPDFARAIVDEIERPALTGTFTGVTAP